MYQILDNLRLTRKHRVTHILNENGGLMWSGKSTGEAVAWLNENEHTEAMLTVGDMDYEVTFKLWPI